SKGDVLLRSGAQKGDRLYVAGELGMAELGLRLQRLSARPDGRALRAHLYPEPQCELGRYLAARRLASAAMDLSDGLSTDLDRLCAASGVGARVFAGQIPCVSSRAALALSRAAALSLALHGGEDYKLLFTVPPKSVPRLPAAFRRAPLVEIGEVTARRAVVLVSATGAERPLVPGGYDHFRRRR
ncbi:MAG: thiamine-phosphate kinase, partial [Terriglobia bacterium]